MSTGKADRKAGTTYANRGTTLGSKAPTDKSISHQGRAAKRFIQARSEQARGSRYAPEMAATVPQFQKISKKAIGLSPNSAFVNNTRAYTFLNLRDRQLDSGFYYLKRAWELDPNDAYNVYCLGSFYSLYTGLFNQSFNFCLMLLKSEVSCGDNCCFLIMQ